MGSITEPAERLLVAKTVMEQGLIQGGEVCAFIENGATQDYCIRLSHRPHLFEAKNRPRSTSRQRSAGGPTDTELFPSLSYAVSAASEPAAVLTGCVDGESPAACADRSAQLAAREGRYGTIAGLCNAIEQDKLRQECRFSAAEEALRYGAGRAIPAAVDLCLAAEEFVSHCLAHGVSRLAERAPPATAGPAAWQSMLQGAEALRGAVVERDPILGEALVTRMYAEAATYAYARAGALDGAPFDALPEAAAEEIRGALAWELVSRGELQKVRTLDRAVGILAEVEARRSPGATSVSRPAEVVVRSRWGSDDRASLEYPAAWWRGPARRPADADPAIDRALAVLEAVADVRGRHDPMLEAAVQHPTRVVSWSAARLVGRPGAAPR